MHVRLFRFVSVLAVLFFVSPAVIMSQDVISSTEDKKSVEEETKVEDKKEVQVDSSPLYTAGDIVITVQEFTDELKKSNRSMGTYRLEILDEMVRNEILYREALKTEHFKESEEIKDPEVPIAFDRKKEIVDAFLKEVIEKDISVTDNEVKEFYEKNRKLFMPPSRYKAHTLLVQKFDRSYTDATDRAKKEAGVIRERLLKGEAPDEIWSSYSDNELLVQNMPGLAVYEGTKNITQEILEFLPEIKKEGTVSPVFELKDSFAVFKVLEIISPKGTSFEEARETIHDGLVDSKVKAKAMEYVRDFIRENKPTVHRKDLLK